MANSSPQHVWRLVPLTAQARPDVWAISRYDGPCEIVAATESRARVQAAGSFCLPVAPTGHEGGCPWLDPRHVAAELVPSSARSAPELIRQLPPPRLAIAAAAASR